MRRAILLVIALVTPLSAFSQTSAITGTVTDDNGNRLADAAIQAANTVTDTYYRARSSPTGEYTVGQLPAGNYVLLVEAAGRRYTQVDIIVRPGETVRADARVRVDLTDITLNTVGEADVRNAKRVEHSAPRGVTPRTADGKPDFSGMWWPQRVLDAGVPEPLPWAVSLIKERTANFYKDYPLTKCLPAGATLFGFIDFYRVVQTPTHLIMIDENDVPGHRQIFLDGRAHPKDVHPTWLGHSIGKWEGDTLVVDTIGFNDRTWITMQTSPHTEEMHLVERFRRPDLGHLEVELTIDDPKAYARPWTIKRVSELAPNEDVMEFVCTENNRDVEHMVGK
jgi:hypothetical protein